MPYRRRRRRRARPRRGRRTFRRRRRKKAPTTAMCRIPRPIKPLKTAYCTHRKILYFRIPGAVPGAGADTPSFVMGGFGQTNYADELSPYPHLLISTNDPLAPVNQMKTPDNFPGHLTSIAGENTPAFFADASDPALTLGLWDSTGADQAELPAGTARVSTQYKNRYPSRWLKMTQFFRKWTVVGSKVRLTFQPNPITAQSRLPDPDTGLRGYTANLANPSIFIFGKRAGRNPQIADYPQALEEQPEYKSIQWFGISTDRAKHNAISFNHKWSAHRDMSIPKGDIVTNESITGFSSANPSRCLLGTDAYTGANLNTNPNSVSQGEGLVEPDASQHPRRQMYYHFCASSGLTDGTPQYSPSRWPAGIIKIVIDYSTVWSQYRHRDNETVIPALPWDTQTNPSP